MKKILTATTGALSTLAFALPAYAQNLDPCAGSGQFSKLCKLNSNNLGSIVGAGIGFLLAIAVIIALFFLVFGGIRWMTSGGDKAKVESARNHIIAALIGLVIAFLAFFILSLALSIFGLSLNKISLPKISGL
jgi:hypothetical protein